MNDWKFSYKAELNVSAIASMEDLAGKCILGLHSELIWE